VKVACPPGGKPRDTSLSTLQKNGRRDEIGRKKGSDKKADQTLGKKGGTQRHKLRKLESKKRNNLKNDRHGTGGQARVKTSKPEKKPLL